MNTLEKRVIKALDNKYAFRDFEPADSANHQDAEPLTPKHPARIAETEDWIITCYGRTDGRAQAQIDIFHQNSDLGYTQKFDTPDAALWAAMSLRQDEMVDAFLIGAGYTRCSGTGTELAQTAIQAGNLTFQPFDAYDWAAFAGAERFHDGSDPIVAYGEDWAFIIGAQVSDERAPQPVQLEIYQTVEEDKAHSYSQTFDRRDMAIFVASHLTAADMNYYRLTGLGFFCHF